MTATRSSTPGGASAVSTNGAARTARRPSRALPRALALVAFCFLASILLRLGERGAAIAEDQPALQIPPVPSALTTAYPTPGCVPPEGTAALLTAIRDREAQLQSRSRSLDEREQVLAVARAKIEEQITALTDAERRLGETLALADKAAEQDVARLVDVYEAMKPAAAAQIFATMDVAFAAGVLARMAPERAGAVLSGIPAERAYAISVQLAGRNLDVPTE